MKRVKYLFPLLLLLGLTAVYAKPVGEVSGADWMQWTHEQKLSAANGFFLGTYAGILEADGDSKARLEAMDSNRGDDPATLVRDVDWIVAYAPRFRVMPLALLMGFHRTIINLILEGEKNAPTS